MNPNRNVYRRAVPIGLSNGRPTVFSMTSDETKIELTADLSQYNHKAACRRIASKMLPYHRHIIWGALALFILAYFVTAYLNVRYDTDAYNVIAFIAFLALAAVLVWALLRRRRIWQTTQEAPSRQGKTSLILDSEGMQVKNPGMHLSYKWTHIVDVIDGPDGLLVLTSGTEFLPIPGHAVPEGTDIDKIKTQIKVWIASAKT